MSEARRAASLLAAAALADAVLGDVAWLPHPVRAVGAASDAAERVLRPRLRGPGQELVAGGVVTVLLVGICYAATSRVLRSARRRSPRAAAVLEIVLGWTTLAARGLLDEAESVRAALDAEDLTLARRRLARIVGRETERLDASEIARATIETLAESACDGVVAPLAAFALGGVPAAMAFKAASTLDSMIGHVDAPYTFYGRVAARLDDALCFVPARLTAWLIVAGSPIARGDARAALAVLRRDGSRHASPNAGRPEAAMAGALGVRLGGTNVYDGVAREAPLLNRGGARPARDDVARAQRIVAVVSLLATAGAIVVRARLTAASSREDAS